MHSLCLTPSWGATSAEQDSQALQPENWSAICCSRTPQVSAQPLIPASLTQFQLSLEMVFQASIASGKLIFWCAALFAATNADILDIVSRRLPAVVRVVLQYQHLFWKMSREWWGLLHYVTEYCNPVFWAQQEWSLENVSCISLSSLSEPTLEGAASAAEAERRDLIKDVCWAHWISWSTTRLMAS